jgi:hypothetical protein
VALFQNGEGSDTLLEGFTLTNGTGTVGQYGRLYGGGVFCEDASPTIRDNRIVENSANYGGAISCVDSAAPKIVANAIVNNAGGGIQSSDAYPEILHNLISENYPNGGTAGGINCHQSFPTIIGNTIVANQSQSGAGIRFSLNPPTIIANNIIAGNIASDSPKGEGGGIFGWQSSPILVNNTIVGNRATGASSEGGGIWFGASSFPNVINTVIWGNWAAQDSEIYVSAGSHAEVNYCDVKGGWTGTGNIDADPLFVDPFGVDFHLTLGSPCRDSGDNTAPGLQDADFEGDPRVALAAVDMGADEFHVHLYFTGDPVPGGNVAVKVVGTPTLPVVLAQGSGLLDPPWPTPHGNFYLQPPLVGLFQLGSIAANGLLIRPVTVPGTWSPGEEYPFQALVGQWNDPQTLLSNLLVLRVE